jgi:hypothetical protein
MTIGLRQSSRVSICFGGRSAAKTSLLNSRIILNACFLNCVFFIGTASAAPPQVVFPLPDGDPGLNLPFQLPNPVSLTDGGVPNEYGRTVFTQGWDFGAEGGTATENDFAFNRYTPSLRFDPFDPPPGGPPAVSMPENKDWAFHVELRHTGNYGPSVDTVLKAVHSPLDYGGTSDGREDNIFRLDWRSNGLWRVYVGAAAGAGQWKEAVRNLVHPPEPQFVNFDVHYRSGLSLMDIYWDNQLVASASTDHGRYDPDFLQFEHIADFGTMTFRNFRWGTLALPATIDGDYNENGVVDAADYVVWRKNLDAVGNPGEVPGDGDDGSGTGAPDGLVDQDDYAFWRSRFGAITPLGSGAGSVLGASVPEPAGALLLTAASLYLVPLASRRARRCSVSGRVVTNNFSVHYTC